jgi:Lon protease-like protein
MTSMPMFPLGSVLFPHMPLALRVFEERYVVMLSRLLQDEPSEFGVVLIERGQEVGGGEKRFSIGTVATITQLEAAEGFVGVVAEGHGRIAITEWLDEDPHPQAVVDELPDLEWNDELQPLSEQAEKLVRRTLARASEFAELNWSPDIELSEEPIARAWQLAAIAPLGPLDQVSLLRSTSMSELLEGIIEHTLGVELSLSSPWADDGIDDASDEPESPY